MTMMQSWDISSMVVINEQTGLQRHPYGFLMFVIGLVNCLVVTIRTCVPSIASRYPLRVKHSNSDIAQLWGILMLSLVLYVPLVEENLPRFPENWLVRNRLPLIFAALVLYTLIYVFSLLFVVTNLEKGQRPAQASNIVRIFVKLSLFIYWGASGEFSRVMSIHPMKLTDEEYMPTQYVIFGICTLYMWEVAFRDLRPVNVVHHALACMGGGLTFEWGSVLWAMRTVVVMPIMGSLIEVFCCMGTMAYRFLPKSTFLQRLMLAEFVFVAVAYNLLLVAYISALYAFRHTFSYGLGVIGMPALAVFTYPAQMNMAKIFYSLSKRAKPAKREIFVSNTVEKAVEHRRRQ
eukprot:TRINITY_DN10242_c0_g1_i1.p1 TRINITY_DN10242_c0_g1~~TRINITY_DN10242_c0_g1_i1.p1  ORF type:complete len:373 (+),score=46.09 TRINITY_DN10242_c0_g1_i1:81-1121(+)